MSTPKRLEYSVSERSGTPAHAEPDWTAEHLLLAGLARCSLSSLEYFAKRVNVEVSGTADADGIVTRRDADGRFAFVETRVALDIQVEPALEGAELGFGDSSVDAKARSSLGGRERASTPGEPGQERAQR